MRLDWLTARPVAHRGLHDGVTAIENTASAFRAAIDGGYAIETDVQLTAERMGGEPVFRGTRVPVKSLFDHLSAGDSLETFLDDFPGVSREQVQAVVEVAGLHLLEEVQNR